MKTAMKVITAAAVLFSAFALTGCDDATNRAPEKPTVAAMIATGTEQATFDCVNGPVSTDCEILAGDQLGSGKWHNAQLSIARNGKVSLTIDGMLYYVDDASTGFVSGTQLATMKMKSLGKATAEVTLFTENSGSRIQVEGFDGDGKKFMDTSSSF